MFLLHLVIVVDVEEKEEDQVKRNLPVIPTMRPWVKKEVDRNSMDNKDKKWLGWRPQFHPQLEDSGSVFFGRVPKDEGGEEVDLSNPRPAEWDWNHRFVHRDEDLPPPGLSNLQQAIWLAKRKPKK